MLPKYKPVHTHTDTHTGGLQNSHKGRNYFGLEKYLDMPQKLNNGRYNDKGIEILCFYKGGDVHYFAGEGLLWREEKEEIKQAHERLLHNKWWNSL